MTLHMFYVYCVSSTVCIRADNKNSIYNKNKLFVVELGFKDPIKALQRFILPSKCFALGRDFRTF